MLLALLRVRLVYLYYILALVPVTSFVIANKLTFLLLVYFMLLVRLTIILHSVHADWLLHMTSTQSCRTLCISLVSSDDWNQH